MEFLKQNWTKIVGIILFLTSGIVALVASAYAFTTVRAIRSLPAPAQATMEVGLSQAYAAGFVYFAVALSCFAIIAFLTLKMFKVNKKIPAITLITGSAIALVMFITGIALASDFLSSLSSDITAARQIPVPDLRRIALNAAHTAHIVQIAQTIVLTLTFAVVPLVIGVKKLVLK